MALKASTFIYSEYLNSNQSSMLSAFMTELMQLIIIHHDLGAGKPLSFSVFRF